MISRHSHAFRRQAGALMRRLGATSLAAVLLTSAALPSQAQDAPARITNVTGAYLAARAASTDRDIGSAAAFYSMVLRGDPTNAGLTERTFLLFISEGNFDEAENLAERLVGFDENSEMARLALATRDVAAGDWDDARDHLTRLGKGPDSAPLSQLLGALLSAWTYAGEQKYDEALKTIADVEGPDWFKMFADYHSGLIADLAGRYPQAETFLAATYQMDPSSLRPAEAYARALAKNGKIAEAQEVLGTLLESGQALPTAAALLSQVSNEPASIEHAIADGGAGYAEVLYGVGTALAGQGGGDVSALYLQLGLHADPDNDLITAALGQLLAGMARYDDAIELYDRIGEQSPLFRTSKIFAADALASQEKYEDAAAQLAPLVEADPKDLGAVTALGNVYRAQEDFKTASEVYTKGIDALASVGPQHWTLFYFRGITYERTDRWPLAEADFRKALELAPNQAQVLNYLGYSWIDQGLNYEEALAMIEEAVKQRPEDGYIIDSLGWAFYKLGRYDEAVKALERAVELMPADPVLNDHLGDAYWRVGRKLEAVFQWTHAKELDPEPEDLTRIVDKLQDGGLADEPVTPPAEKDG